MFGDRVKDDEMNTLLTFEPTAFSRRAEMDGLISAHDRRVDTETNALLPDDDVQLDSI